MASPMPQKAKGPRLYPRPEQRDDDGNLVHNAVWTIRDRGREKSTGCHPDDVAGAERALALYIARKHLDEKAQAGLAGADAVTVADVIGLYAKTTVNKLARPKEATARLLALNEGLGAVRLVNLTGDMCRVYAEGRSQSAARRELEDLRAAINTYRREHLNIKEPLSLVLPAKEAARERFLTFSEVALLLWKAWRYREKQNLRATDRLTRRHIAKFVLVAVHTGTRASAICEAALQPTEGHGWIDLEKGVFYRRAPRAKETNKRRPAIRLPDSLLAHLRRWKRNGARFVVEWNGLPVKRISKAFAAVVRDAGLGEDVTPHSLRHTAATWQMQAGTDPHQAAGYLGMSRETMDRVYAHHHPDHQEQARTARRRRSLPGSYQVEQDKIGTTVVEKPPKPRKTAAGD